MQVVARPSLAGSFLLQARKYKSMLYFLLIVLAVLLAAVFAAIVANHSGEWEEGDAIKELLWYSVPILLIASAVAGGAYWVLRWFGVV